MSRPLRIQYPDAWYHIINRGLNHRRIFDNDTHRLLFLELLADIHTRYGIEVHAYCLMDNHYHLLLHTPHPNLSRAMRHLDGVYTQKYNLDTERDGALFRGRFKSILVEAENYLLQLSRYIHLNPVSAKICDHPNKYKWSSFPAYINQVEKPIWLYRDECLSRCSENLSAKKYQEYVEETSDIKFEEKLEKACWRSILGNQEWIEKIKKYCKADDEIPASKDISSFKKSTDISTLILAVMQYYNVDMEILKVSCKSHTKNKPRDMFIYVAMELFGFESKIVAEILQNTNSNAIRQLKVKVKKRLVNDEHLATELEDLKKYLYSQITN